jgi:hypothetical protein
MKLFKIIMLPTLNPSPKWTHKQSLQKCLEIEMNCLKKCLLNECDSNTESYSTSRLRSEFSK